MKKLSEASVGPRIKELRKSMGWTAMDLSRATNGVATRGRIAQLECGSAKDLPLSVALAIAEAFGIGLDELMDRDLPAKALAVACELWDARLRLDEAMKC